MDPALEKDQQSDLPLEPEAQAIVESMADDAYIPTVQLLEDAGVSELNPEFAGMVLVDGEIDGQVTLRYYEDSPSVDKLLEIVERANREAPVEIVAVPSRVNIGLLEEVALELTDEGGAVAQKLGVPDAVGASYDMKTGEFFLLTSDKQAVERLAKDGEEPVVEYKGIRIVVQYDPSDPEAGFQAI